MRGHSHLILVFSNLLAFKDQDQYVDKTELAIAQEVGLTEEQVRAALDELEAPDPKSRSKAYEGRRLLRIDAHRDWGWFVVNGEFYDRIRNAEERRRQNREAQAAKRERDRALLPVTSNAPSADVSRCQQPSAKSASVSGAVAGAVTEPPNPLSGFETFWNNYPNKAGKKDAIKAWTKLKPNPDLQLRIIQAITAQRETRKWREGFIPLPATFLNGERWEDQIELPIGVSKSEQAQSERDRRRAAAGLPVHSALNNS